MAEYTEIVEALKGECNYIPTDETIEAFLAEKTEVRYDRKTMIVAPGDVDRNLYIICDGMVRIAYYDGNKEFTFGFASRGTLFMSLLGFFNGRPAHFFYETCAETVLWKIKKDRFMHLLATIPDMALWILNICFNQMYTIELKSSLLNGSAKDKYEALIDKNTKMDLSTKNPTFRDNIRKVPSKILATYLGMTPEYFSYTRKKVLSGKKDAQTPDSADSGAVEDKNKNA